MMTFAHNDYRAADRSRASPKVPAGQHLRWSWEDFERILEDIETSEETCSKPLSILSRDHLNDNIHQRVRSDIDDIGTKKPHGFSESVSKRLQSSLLSLGLIEDLEGDVEEQQHKSLINENNKPQGFSRREYNAFMGRMRLHML
jgi:hypothetical protein